MAGSGSEVFDEVGPKTRPTFAAILVVAIRELAVVASDREREGGIKAVLLVVGPAQAEARTVQGAIRTDFILSAEIMVIALKEVIDEGFVSRAVILALVAVLITVLVYGVVALIVKMDDVGLRMVESGRSGAVRAEP